MVFDDQNLSPDASFVPVGDRDRIRAPRFARLVQSPVARRLAPKRLILATFLGGGLLWAGAIASWHGANSLAGWVGRQPEHQIAFESVELIPPPPPYIPSGAGGILDAVRLATRRDPQLSVLNTDLEALRVDLSQNPWIERTGTVRASYRRLAVEVAYRKPLAVVIVDPSKNEAMVVDRHAVELPIENKQFELVEAKQQYQVVGDSKCLIQIRGVGSPLPNRKGLTWKSADPAISDQKILEAVDLVQFLYDRSESKSPSGRPMPDFRVIHFIHQSVRNSQGSTEDVQGFFLLDASERYVFWNSAPGRESREEASASQKWSMLAHFIDEKGPLSHNLHESEWLVFGAKVAKVARAPSTPAARRPRPQNRSWSNRED